MDKPVTIIREELRVTITNAVNNSNLPAFVVADMFEKFLVELKRLEQQQYNDDFQRYQQSQEERERDSEADK